jgi:hypothetical protein
MTFSEATGWGRPRLRGGGERFSRVRPSGKVSDYGAANRGTHFSSLHHRGARGRYMNRQVRARLMLRTKWLRCRRTPERARRGAPWSSRHRSTSGSAGAADSCGRTHEHGAVLRVLDRRTIDNACATPHDDGLAKTRLGAPPSTQARHSCVTGPVTLIHAAAPIGCFPRRWRFASARWAQEGLRPTRRGQSAQGCPERRRGIPAGATAAAERSPAVAAEPMNRTRRPAL